MFEDGELVIKWNGIYRAVERDQVLSVYLLMFFEYLLNNPTADFSFPSYLVNNLALKRKKTWADFFFLCDLVLLYMNAINLWPQSFQALSSLSFLVLFFS